MIEIITYIGAVLGATFFMLLLLLANISLMYLLYNSIKDIFKKENNNERL